MRNRQKSCYRQCCIPSTLKDKIVKFLVVFNYQKITYENLLKILEIRYIQFFFVVFGQLFHSSFVLELLLVP